MAHINMLHNTHRFTRLDTNPVAGKNEKNLSIFNKDTNKICPPPKDH